MLPSSHPQINPHAHPATPKTAKHPYFWYFQNQRVAEDVIRADDFAFIDRIWADWSPGYDASEDLPKVKECIRDPAHFKSGPGLLLGTVRP
jgi:hypothetical protein